MLGAATGRVKHASPLVGPPGRGEYGLVAIVRGQPNMVEVFDFGVD
jgi:hypothetical protein